MVAKTTQMVGDDDELTPAQLKSAAYYQSPEGLAKLDANQKTAANINALKQQILASSNTSKWTGEGYGGPDKNANAMAELMAKAGITDIKQFGKVDKYEPVQVVGYSLNGKQVQNPSKGVYYESIPEPDGEGGISGYRRRDLTPAEIAQVKPQYGVVDTQTDEVKPVTNVVERDGKLVGVTGQTWGNKATGQTIDSGTGRWQRQGGENLFGGTGAGDGNTGFRVNLQPDGTPVFYTTYGSSNDLANLMSDLGPIFQIGMALATGGLSIPQQIAANMAIQVAAGQDIGDAIKNAAVSIAVANVPGSDFMKETTSLIKDMGLDQTMTNTLTNAAQNAAASGVRAAATGKSIGDAMLMGAASGGVNGAVTALMASDDMASLTGDLSATQKRMVANAITSTISGKPLDQTLINTAIAIANEEARDQAKYKPLSTADYDMLDADQKRVYDESGTKGLTQFNRDIRNLTGLTTSGRTGDDMGGDDGSTTNSDADADTVDTLTKAGLINTTPANNDAITITGDRQGATSTDATSMSTDTTKTTTPTTKVTDAGTVKVTSNRCEPGYVYDETLKICVPIQTTTTDTTTKTTTPTTKTTDAGTVTVTDKKCETGYVYDEILKICVPIKTTETDVRQLTGSTQELKCQPGFEPNAAGTACIPVVTITDKKCATGYVYDETLKICVPIQTTTTDPTTKTDSTTKTDPTTKTTTPTTKTTTPTTNPAVTKKPSFTTSGITTSAETTNPIYAGGMSDFNLYATMEELLADRDAEKDSKNSKDETKMASGGHLDDLLAEQLTVDDLLNLLR